MNIIQSWISNLQGLFTGESLTVTEVRVGVFYSAAQLSTGHVGVAFTPRGLTDSVCCPKTAASAPFVGKIGGRDAWAIAEFAQSRVPLRRTVGVAALNALSALAIARHGAGGGRLIRGLDALDAADVRADDRVVMVGAFAPFLKKLKGHTASLLVIDSHPEALKPDELIMWRPPSQAEETLAQASIVIISGSALVEGELDGLLRAASAARKIVLAGPTASPWPPPFFERGIAVLGGIRVLDNSQMLGLVSEGGSGYFFDRAAEKISILREANGRGN